MIPATIVITAAAVAMVILCPRETPEARLVFWGLLITWWALGVVLRERGKGRPTGISAFVGVTALLVAPFFRSDLSPWAEAAVVPGVALVVFLVLFLAMGDGIPSRRGG